MPLFEDNFNQVFDHMTNSHRRVLPVRVDLRFPQGYGHDGGNREIQSFHKRMGQHCRNNATELRYHTVREQASSDTPHYHVMLFLDGDRVRSPLGVKKNCTRIWNDIVGYEGNGLVDYCVPKPEYPIEPLRMVHRPSSKAMGSKLDDQRTEFEAAKAIVGQHAAYLNKPETKGNAPHRIREVFTSQVRGKKS